MKQLGLTCIVIFASVVIFAQSAITTSGSNAGGNGGSVSYTVGQIAFLSLKGANSSITQGVQQPYEISVVTGIDTPTPIDLTCEAYPNPVSETLWLKIESNETNQFRYQLFDALGKLLVDNRIDGLQASISMQSYPSAVYFLKVFGRPSASANELKTFKIVKH